MSEGEKKMEINTGNYEVFIVDYLDGKLGALEIAQLLLFLENNPHLKEEFEELKVMTVTPPSNELYGFNESLKQPFDADAKNLTLLNYQHYFIASVENDLTLTGIKNLNNFIHEHPELNSEFKLFKSTKLVPDSKIKYPKPETLRFDVKKTAVVRPLFTKYYFAAGIAASLLLLFTIWLRLTPGTESDLDKNLKNSIEKQGNIENSQSEDRNTMPDLQNQSTTSSQESSGNEKLNKESGNSEPGTLNKEQVTGNKKQETLNTKPESNKKRQLNGEKGSIRRGTDSDQRIMKIEKKGMVTNNTPLYSENTTRNFYSGIYNDIQLSQEMALAEKEQPVASTKQEGEEKKGSVKAARIISSVITSGEQLVEQIPGSLNGWLFADMGVKGFNLLTNNSYSLDRKLNNKGRIESLKITKTEENL